MEGGSEGIESLWRDIMVVASGPWALFQIGKLRHPKDKLFFFLMGCLLPDAGTGDSL